MPLKHFREHRLFLGTQFFRRISEIGEVQVVLSGEWNIVFIL